MRRYESVVILDPELADDDIRNFTEKYSSLIKAGGGEVIKIEDWGSKRLAYLVKKKDKGRYILFDFVGLPDLIAELERQFKISDEVMKFLSVKLDEDVDLEAFRAASKEKEAAAEVPTPSMEPAVEPAAAEPEGLAAVPEEAATEAQMAASPEQAEAVESVAQTEIQEQEPGSEAKKEGE